MQSAILLLRRGLRPDGSYDGVDEGEIAEHQWRLLEGWAEKRGLILPPIVAPAREGGREHDVSFDPEHRRWLKFTKPNCAGYAVEVIGPAVEMMNATPLKYLERWRIGNKLFGDDAHFVGLSKCHGGNRLVISQPHIRGVAPSWEDVESAFTRDLQLHPLSFREPLGGYDARAYFRGRTGVFDVRPLNCIFTEKGLVLPIDVIPQYFTLEESRVLRSLSVQE